MDGLSRLNSLPAPQAAEELLRCCGSRRWAKALASKRPFARADGLFKAAREVWSALEPKDWLEAFAEHPRIGGKDALRARFASTRAWAASEQSGAADAAEGVLDALAEGNRSYEERFGFIFIVCATGKSASEMLDILRGRLGNDPALELRVAAGEQAKITEIRLKKLLEAP